MKKNFILTLLFALIFFKAIAEEGNLCLARISENSTLCIQYDDYKSNLYLYEDEILKKINIPNLDEIKILDCKSLEYKNLNGFLLLGKKSENSFASIIYEYENNFILNEIISFDFDVCKIEQYFLDNNFLTFYCSGNKALYKINLSLEEKRLYNSRQIFNSLDLDSEKASFYSQLNLNTFVCLVKISNKNLNRFFLVSDLDENFNLYEYKNLSAQNLNIKSYSCDSKKFYFVLNNEKDLNFILSFDVNDENKSFLSETLLSENSSTEILSNKESENFLSEEANFTEENLHSYNFLNFQILDYVNVKTFEQKCELFNLKNSLQNSADYSLETSSENLSENSLENQSSKEYCLKIFYNNKFFAELQSEKEIVFYQIFADSYDFILSQNGEYKYFCLCEEDNQLKLLEKNLGENLIYLGCSFDENILNYFYNSKINQIDAFLLEYGNFSKEKSFIPSLQINSYANFIQDFDCKLSYKNLFSSPSSFAFLSLNKKILCLDSKKSEFKIIETDFYTQSSFRWGISYIAYLSSGKINFVKIEAL